MKRFTAWRNDPVRWYRWTLQGYLRNDPELIWC